MHSFFGDSLEHGRINQARCERKRQRIVFCCVLTTKGVSNHANASAIRRLQRHNQDEKYAQHCQHYSARVDFGHVCALFNRNAGQCNEVFFENCTQHDCLRFDFGCNFNHVCGDLASSRQSSVRDSSVDVKVEFPQPLFTTFIFCVKIWFLSRLSPLSRKWTQLRRPSAVRRAQSKSSRVRMRAAPQQWQ